MLRSPGSEQKRRYFSGRDLGVIALFAVAYVVAYGYGSLFPQSRSAPLWFPDSVLLCALLLAPKEKWWLYLLAAAPIRFLPGLRPPAPGWFIWATFINDAAKAVLSAALLRRLAGDVARLNTIRKLVAYFCIAVLLVPTLSAVAGAAARRALGFDFLPSLRQWFLGDALTNLAITPTLLLWFSGEYRQLQIRWGEAALWIASFAVCLRYTLLLVHSSDPPMALYAPLPFLVWAAARLGTVAASSALSVTALFLMLAVGPTHTPLSSQAASHNLHFVQLFLGTVCLPILFVAVLLEERRRIEQRLRESQEELNRDYQRVSDLSRRLISAQGDERKRIAGELHDDVSQRLALQIASLESELTTSSLQLQRFLEAAPTGLLRCSSDLRYLAANSAYSAIAGLPVDQIVGRRIVDVIGPDAWETLRPYIERVRNGERVEFETLVPYAAAGPRQVHVVGVPEKEGEEVVGWVGSVTDITEFKRVEKQLQEVEKIAAAGQLAASLAHEINNPLTAVINVLYLLERRTDLDPMVAGLISGANNEIARVARIVKQSLSYYRAGLVAKKVDLAALIEESLQVFSDKFQRSGIVISKKITPGTSIIGFADEIRQVVDNLLVNAVEATARGGRLAVCMRSSRSWKNRNQLGARLTVADNGSGIPKAYLARVFEPFFTTKAEKGTGLGLWVVKGIVEKRGGNIKLRSTDAAARSGTVVSIFWPSAAEAHLASKLSRSEYAA